MKTNTFYRKGVNPKKQNTVYQIYNCYLAKVLVSR